MTRDRKPVDAVPDASRMLLTIATMAAAIGLLFGGFIGSVVNRPNQTEPVEACVVALLLTPDPSSLSDGEVATACRVHVDDVHDWRSASPPS